jgi:hypothetical protein
MIGCDARPGYPTCLWPAPYSIGPAAALHGVSIGIRGRWDGNIPSAATMYMRPRQIGSEIRFG